jgi:hypothetical protein
MKPKNNLLISTLNSLLLFAIVILLFGLVTYNGDHPPDKCEVTQSEVEILRRDVRILITQQNVLRRAHNSCVHHADTLTYIEDVWFCSDCHGGER